MINSLNGNNQEIIFVSKINPLTSNATSGDIMIYNIISGLSQITKNIILVAFTYDDTEYINEQMTKCYGNLVKKIYIFKSKIGENKGKYSYLLKQFEAILFKSYYKEVSNIIGDIADNPLIISHSPAIESICFCKCLKNRYFKSRWIQYWSDPIAMSGINPEKMNFKRFPFYLLEKSCFSKSDKIVYGTKTLFEFQSQLFKGQKDKMTYVDVSYYGKELDFYEDNYKNDVDFLYAGNFFSYTRNIKPLCEAIDALNGEKKLVIYGSGDQFYDSKFVEYNDRISPLEVRKIEKEYKNIICLLNSKCIQIPGKTFYDIRSNKNILVIVDGTHKKELVDYLDSYKRFIIVNNDVDSIVEGIKRIEKSDFKVDIDFIDKNFSPERIASKLIE